MSQVPVRMRGMFHSGQKVEVRQDGIFQYADTVVGYTRNLSFQIREPDTGSVCDYRYTDLCRCPQPMTGACGDRGPAQRPVNRAQDDACLGKGGVVPYHDAPGMTAISPEPGKARPVRNGDLYAQHDMPAGPRRARSGP